MAIVDLVAVDGYLGSNWVWRIFSCVFLFFSFVLAYPEGAFIMQADPEGFLLMRSINSHLLG